LGDEIENLNNKIAFLEQVTNANVLEYRDNTDDLTNRVFVLENALIKKDNLLKYANKKLNRLIEKQVFSEEAVIDKEIYVRLYLIPRLSIPHKPQI
jgi:hypothetical protein